MRRRASVVVRTSFILWFLLAACGTQPERERDLPETQLPAPVATLRVALFPYLPDSGRDQFASFTRFVEGAFRTKYPTINLVLRPMDPNDDFYDWDTLKAWLTSPAEKPGYDLIEVDTVLLGDLVTAGLVAPWERVPGTADWHPVSARAVRINDAVYGIPHLLCGH